MDKVEVSNNFKKKKNNNVKLFLGIFLMVVISFSLCAGLMHYYSLEGPTIVTKNRTISETKVSEVAMEDAIAKIYDAVLCIEVLDASGEVISSGTGFVYGKDDKYGYVLTNSHVVSNGTNIKGVLSNDKTVDLKVLGTDSYTDLAVLRMNVKEVLQVASIGTSENTKLGNTVFTVGSPMGVTYAGTVTRGILSGKDRLVETQTTTDGESFIVKVLQTDAAISPGNSGGPLVNLAGDVIGITSLKLVNNEVEGMGFAIPIEDAMQFVDTLEKGKIIKRPLMGVQIIDTTNTYALYRYNISIPKDVTGGIIIINTTEDYPAEVAGLKKGDLITKIDGEKITSTAEFKYELYKHAIGDVIEITYIRDGKEKQVKLKLDKSN